MADPISIIGLVVTCGTIVKALRDVYETLKDGPAALKELLNRTTALSLLLRRLQAFEQQLSLDQKEFLSAYFDSSRCHDTISALSTLVDQTRTERKGIQSDLKGRIKWLLSKSDAEGLVIKLEKQQTDILMAINIISSESIQEILTIVDRNQPITVFNDNPHPKDNDRRQPSTDAQDSSPSTVQVRNVPFGPGNSVIVTKEKPFLASNYSHIWFGQTHDKEELRLNPEYVQDRARLANAAYVGGWFTVFSRIQTFGEKYDQLWINCFRMGDNLRYEISGFTALHQAAYFGASVEVVKQLIAMGAWRMARAVRAPRQGLTPLDIARSAGFEHLYEILSPLIKHTIPFKTILALETQLHMLIRREAEIDDRLNNLRLPDLSILLELEVMEMWFPVTALSPEGFIFRIDGQELLVKSIWKTRKDRIYRVTESTIVEIQEAVVVYR